MTEVYTTSEIISAMKDILNVDHDNELAEYLGTSKQTIYQYKKKVNSDVQQKIISELLNLLKEK